MSLRSVEVDQQIVYVEVVATAPTETSNVLAVDQELAYVEFVLPRVEVDQEFAYVEVTATAPSETTNVLAIDQEITYVEVTPGVYTPGTPTSAATSASLKGQADTKSSAPAYTEGGSTSPASYTQAYTSGSVNDQSSVPAYLTGVEGASASISAYLRGVEATSSQPAYTTGHIAVKSSQQAHLTGSTYNKQVNNVASSGQLGINMLAASGALQWVIWSTFAGVIYVNKILNGNVVGEYTYDIVNNGIGSSINAIDAQIDGSGNIHILFVGNAYLRYCLFNTNTNTFGTFEDPGFSAYTTTGLNGSTLSLDSNGIPHIAFRDIKTTGGTQYRQIYYSNRIGGTWATPTRINATTNADYQRPEITHGPSDQIEIAYIGNLGNLEADGQSNHYNGSWGGEQTYSAICNNSSHPYTLIDSDGTVYRYFLDYTNGDIRENGNVIARASASYLNFSVSIQGTNRVLLYIDRATNDLKVMYNNSGGWMDGGTLHTGTIQRVGVMHQYNFDGSPAQTIYYAYQVSSRIWIDFYTIPFGASGSIPAFTQGLLRSSAAAFMEGQAGTNTSSSIPAYLSGPAEVPISTSQAAFIYGQANTSNEVSAYLNGVSADEIHTSKIAYLQGGATSYPFTDDFTGADNDPWSTQWNTSEA